MRKITKKNLTPQEFFESKKVKNYLLNKLKKIEDDFAIFNANLYLSYIPNNQNLAYTENFQIHCNAGHKLFSDALKALEDESLENYLNFVLGVLLHEEGHRLFTNFSYNKKYMSDLSNGILSPTPSTTTEDDDLKLEELKQILSIKNNMEFICQYVGQINNCIEDIRMERVVFELETAYPQAVKGLKNFRKAEQILALPYEEKIEMDTNPFQIFLNMIYNYSHFEDDTLPAFLEEQYRNEFELLKPIIQIMIEQNFAETYYKHLNDLLMIILPKCLKEAQPSSSEQCSDSDNGDNSSFNPEISQKIKNSINEMIEKMKEKNIQNVFKDNENIVSEGLDNTDIHTMNEKLKEIKVIENEEKNFNQFLAMLMKQLRNEANEQEAKQEISAEFNKMSDINPKIKSQIQLKYVSYTDDLKNNYDLYYKKEVEKQTKKLLKKCTHLLKTSFEYEQGKYFGEKFNPNAICKGDYKTFSQKNTPEYPSIAIGIALDESSSMLINNKYEHCKKMLMILKNFADKLNIPIEIIGFNSVNNHHINIYSDINHPNKNDLYKLTANLSYGGNRDGLALHYIINKILSTNLDNKIIFINLAKNTRDFSREMNWIG